VSREGMTRLEGHARGAKPTGARHIHGADSGAEVASRLGQDEALRGRVTGAPGRVSKQSQWRSPKGMMDGADMAGRAERYIHVVFDGHYPRRDGTIQVHQSSGRGWVLRPATSARMQDTDGSGAAINDGWR